MFNQVIFGMPKRCANRNCRHPFYQESHLGWLPKNEVEAFAIMRCPKCKDTFKVTQMLSMVHGYKENLPRDPRIVKLESPITTKEIEKMRKKLETGNPLKTLYPGYKPGASNQLPEDK